MTRRHGKHPQALGGSWGTCRAFCVIVLARPPICRHCRDATRTKEVPWHQKGAPRTPAGDIVAKPEEDDDLRSAAGEEKFSPFIVGFHSSEFWGILFIWAQVATALRSQFYLSNYCYYY